MIISLVMRKSPVVATALPGATERQTRGNRSHRRTQLVNLRSVLTSFFQNDPIIAGTDRSLGRISW
jgi:hypothetical protein